MLIIGHRGASYDAPENTLAAVRLALDQEADGVEIDVHLSRDRKIVVIHDYSVKKTTGVSRRVSSLPLKALRQLDAGSWKHPKFNKERIPTLQEVVEVIPKGKPLLVEIKCGSEILQPLNKLLKTVSKLKRIIPIGFSYETMCAIKKQHPALKVYWVVAFRKNAGTGRWTPGFHHLIRKARSGGLDGLDVGANRPLTKSEVEQVHNAGLGLYVWTVDSVQKARQLARVQVDGIATNKPGWMIRQLK